MSKLLRQSIAITGAGRTDTGVNARQMFAHFDAEEPIENSKRFLLSLNSMAGKDINVKRLIPVGQNCHARFDASEREYKYFISYDKDPFLKEFFWRSY